MKKLTFKVKLVKDNMIATLIKEINKISCRTIYDTVNRTIVIEEVEDGEVDEVMDFVNNYFTVLSIDMDNVQKKAIEENQDMDKDLIGQNSEYIENMQVKSCMNKLMKTACWAIHNKSVDEEEICSYITTCMSEIRMRYASTIIDCKAGDVVDVNYGVHLPGEIIGGHVNAIVCHVVEGIAYVVPVFKKREGTIRSMSYMPLYVPQDVVYENEAFGGGIVFLDKGKYVRVERFNAVIGRTNPEFFKKLLNKLAGTFDFTDVTYE